MKLLLRAAFFVLLATLASAGGMDKVLLKDGTLVQGKIRKDTGEAIVVADAWGKETTVPYGDIDPRTLFRLKMGRVKRSDGRGQLELAQFACDLGLWAQSRKHYRWAETADSKLHAEIDAGLEKLRDKAGASLLMQARQAAAAGNVDKAQRLLTTIIRELPDESVARLATQELAKIQPSARKQDVEAYRRKISPRLKAVLAPARQHYERMLDQRHKGQSSIIYGDKAIPHFQNAVQSGNMARRMWRQIKNQHRNDAELNEIVAFVDQTLNQNLVELHLHLAKIYSDKRQYGAAQKEVDKAIRISPSDGKANSLRMQIQHGAKVKRKQQELKKRQEAYEDALRAYYANEDYYAYGRWVRGRNRRINRRNN